MAFLKHKFAWIFWAFFFCLILLFGIFWFLYLQYIEYTDDAYVQGNQVYITPLHEGFITSIHTDDSFLVKRGQLLVTLDETNDQIALEKAKSVLAQTVRNVCQQFHEAFAFRAEIDEKKAEWIRNAQDVFHRAAVFQEQAVSLEDYEHAIAALRAQYSSLQKSEALYHKAIAPIQNISIQNNPWVIQAADGVRHAWVNLYRCRIYSPVEGLASQRTAQVGMWVRAGDILLNVIPLDQIWVNANYKETQIKNLRLGHKVDITADLWGSDHIFHGTIVGLPGGAGNAFSLLPPQNLSGNWIKIVQRLPVRVALDPKEIQEYPLRIGLSCKAFTNTKKRFGKIVPDTTAGSPLYETPIFQNEEVGDQEWIQKITHENLDPLLSNYENMAAHFDFVNIDLAALLEEALKEETELKNAVQVEIPFSE